MTVYLVNQECDFRPMDDAMLIFHGGSGETYQLAGVPACLVAELLRTPEASTLESLVIRLSDPESQPPVVLVEEALGQLRKAGVVSVRHP